MLWLFRALISEKVHSQIDLWYQKERETHRTRQYRDTTPGKHLRQIRSTSTSTSQFPKSRMLETLSDAPQDTHTYPHHPLSHTLITHTETDEEWVISILTHPMASSLNCPSASPALHHLPLSTPDFKPRPSIWLFIQSSAPKPATGSSLQISEALQLPGEGYIKYQSCVLFYNIITLAINP